MQRKKIIALASLSSMLFSFLPVGFDSEKNTFTAPPTAHAAASADCKVAGSATPSALATNLGEAFSFDVTISNSGGDPGFSPMIELFLPSQVTFNSASFTTGGLAVSAKSPTPVTITDGDGGSATLGTFTNPITNVEYGPDDPNAIVGHKYYAFELPLGSFVPGQTEVGLTIDATLANGLTPGVNLTDGIAARCGYALGSDELNNPGADPPVVSSFIEMDVTPTVFDVSKSLATLHGEDETATGENFPVTYTIAADIATNEQVSSLSLSENIPTNFQFTKVTAVDDNGAGYNITFTPFGQAAQTSSSVPFTPTGPFLPGGSLSISYAAPITGAGTNSDINLVFEGYVPELDQSSSAVLSPTTGAAVVIPNTASGSGTHVSGPVAATSDTVNLTARSLATQKSVAISNNAGPAGFSPGDQLEYTLDFQVSDYFTFNQLVLEDLMGDGLSYTAASTTLSVTEDGTTTNSIAFSEATISNQANLVTGPAPYDFSGAECVGCELAITADTVDDDDAVDPPADGETVLAFDVSTAMDGEVGLDDTFVGGMVGPVAAGQPTQGTVKFRANINDDYVDGQTFDRSVDSFDPISNSETVSGRITSSGSYVTDTSSANITIVPTTFAKGIEAFNDVLSGVDAAPFGPSLPLSIAPGDVLVYSLTTTIPSGDLEDLQIEDFLPIPFFDVDDANADSVADSFSFDAATLTTQYTPADGDSSTTSIPAVGTIGYGDGTSGPAGFMSSLPTPAISQNNSGNTLIVDFPDSVSFDIDPSEEITIELLFSIEATNKPFADGLLLVNFANFVGGHSNNSTITSGSQTANIITEMPGVTVYKGAVATDAASPTFTPSQVGPTGVTFTPANSPIFSPAFGSTALQANKIESDLSGVDAGDEVTFVMAFESTGSGKVYDLIMTDTLPSGFVSPATAAALNLQVYTADGTDVSGSTSGGLFGEEVLSGTTDGTDTSITFAGPLGEYHATNGTNIIVVSYDLVVDQAVEARETLTNLGALTQFTATTGGANFVQQASLYQETVDVTVGDPSVVKTNLDSTVNNDTNTGSSQHNGSRRDLTIGESSKYRLTITMPEGTTPSVSFSDNLPSGLGYDTDVGVSVITDGSCGVAAFNGTVPAVTVTSPSGPGIAGSGNNIEFNFNSAIITTNDNVTTNNSFCVEYDAVMLDIGGNNGTSSMNRRNRATMTFGTGGESLPQVDSRVDVVEPELTVAKTVDTNTGEAGDVREYRVVVDHSGDSTAPAYDLEITDVLPAGVTAVGDFDTDGLDNDGDGLIDGADGDELAGNLAPFYTSATDTFFWTSTTTNNAEFDQLLLTEDIDFRFNVSIDNDVYPTQVIGNTASVDYDTVAGTPTKGIERSKNANGNVSITIDNVGLTKTVNTTSESATAASQHNAALQDLAIGEKVTYHLTHTIPESQISNFLIQDTLPDVFEILSATVVQDDTSSTANPISFSDTQNSDGIDDTLSITFPTITNAPDADTELLIVSVEALVRDNVANFNTSTAYTNTSSANWDNAAAALNSSADVNIVEPDLDLAKTINTNTGDAGDTREYRIVVDHNGSSTADAFDISITDTLPAGVTAVGDFNTDGLDNDGDGLIDGADPDELAGDLAPFYTLATDSFTWNATTTNNAEFDQLALAQDIDFRFNVMIDNSVFPAQVITNTAQVNWDSLAADGDPNERSDNDSGNVALTINALSPSKSVLSTSFNLGSSQFNGALPDVAVGDQITYRVSMPVPESTFTNFTITDNMPEDALGVRFRADSGTLIQDDGVGHTNPPTVTLSDQVGSDGINDRVVFDFGTITNMPDADTETIVVEIKGTVIDNTGNVAGTGYTNTAEIDYTELVGGPISVDADVDLVDPSVSIVKSVTPLTGDSGDEFTYTISMVNTGTGAAYDLNITDQLPTEFDVNGAFDTDGLDNDGDGVTDNETLPAGYFVSATRLFTWNASTTGVNGASPSFAQLDPGDSLVFKYKGNLNSTVNPVDVINNDVDLTYDSAPGANPSQRTKQGTAVANVNVPLGGALSKTLRDADVDKVIGETIPYRVTVTIPEGTIAPLQVTDTLPAGLAFVPLSTSITNVDSDLTLGTPSPTPSETPTSATIGAGQTQQIVFDFGTVVNSDTNNGNTETFDIEYDAVVINTSDNANGNTKINSVSADFGGAGTVGPVNGPTVTIREPNMAIVKSNNPAYVSGNTARFEVRLENNGTASAHDLEVSDVLPAGMTYNSSFVVTNGPAFTVDTSGAPTIKFTTSEVTTAFNSANPVIFSYDVSIAPSVASGTVLGNSATAKYSSLSGDPAGAIGTNTLSKERTGDVTDPGGVQNDYSTNDTASITVTRPNLSTSTKTVTDVNGGNVKGNDVLTYAISIVNSGNVAATGIRVTDNIPANVTNFTMGSSPGGSTVNFSAAPAGANSNGFLEVTNISVNAASTEVVTYQVNVNAGIAPGVMIDNSAVIDPPTEGGPGGSGMTSLTVFAPVLEIEKTVSDDHVAPLVETFTYTITVRNTGNLNSTNTTIVDPLPANVGYVYNSLKIDGVAKTDAVDADEFDFAVTNANAVTVKFAALPPSTGKLIQFDAVAGTAAAGTYFTNTATVTDDEGSNKNDSVTSRSVHTDETAPKTGGGGTSTPGGGGGGGGTPDPEPEEEEEELKPSPEEEPEEDGPEVNNTVKEIFGNDEGNTPGADDIKARIDQLIKEGKVDEILALISNNEDVCGPLPLLPIEVKSCLDFDPKRPVQFSDIGDVSNEFVPFIKTLKNTKIISEGDYIVSGHGNHSSGKQQSKFAVGEWQFQPHRPVTRLEVVKVILVSNCIPIEDEIPVPEDGFRFKDVPVDVSPDDELMHFVARVFYTAYKHKVITGFGDGHARPFAQTSVPEILAIALRGSQAIPQGYDLKTTPWYNAYLTFAELNSILPKSELKADLLMDRKRFAQVVVRVMSFNPNPGVHGYIERVDINRQKFLAYEDVYSPIPDMSAFDGGENMCEVTRSFCLEHDNERPLRFADISMAEPYNAQINILRATKIISDGDYIASGTRNHSTGKQQDKFKLGVWNYEPDRVATRLEVVKTALVSNCIPVEDEIPVPADGFEFSDLKSDISKDAELMNFVARVFYTAYKHGIITREQSMALPFQKIQRADGVGIFKRAAGGNEVNVVNGQVPLRRNEMAKWVVHYMRDNQNRGIAQYAQLVMSVYGLKP